MQEIILKVRYFERGLSKSLKKVTSFVLSNPVPFNRQNYQKQKGPGTSDQWLFRLQNKFRKIPFLVIKKNVIAPFYGCGSTASRLEPL